MFTPITINLRNPNATDWDSFWQATMGEEEPLQRFGFRLLIKDDPVKDALWIQAACMERMKYVKRILREEEDALRHRGFQMVHECKSHRSWISALRGCKPKIRTATKRIRLTPEQREEAKKMKIKNLLGF